MIEVAPDVSAIPANEVYAGQQFPVAAFMMSRLMQHCRIF